MPADIKIVESKIDQVLKTLGLINTTPITQAQKDKIALYIEDAGNYLIDAFYEGAVPNTYSFVIDDLDTGDSFKVTVKRITK